MLIVVDETAVHSDGFVNNLIFCTYVPLFTKL